MNDTIKKVSELQDPKYHLVTDQSSIQEILHNVGCDDEWDQYGCIFVWADEGDYQEIWGIESNVPYLHYSAEKLYPVEQNVNPMLEEYSKDTSNNQVAYMKCKKENIDNYTELSKIDADVWNVRELDPKDINDQIWIKHGHTHMAQVGYPASMGERGYNVDFLYDNQPTAKQIWDDLIEQYKEDIKDGEYEPGKMRNLDAYEEQAYKKIKAILNRLKIKIENLHAIGNRVNMGGLDNHGNSSDYDVTRCDKCFELSGKLYPCKCKDEKVNICRECWVKNGMPEIIKESIEDDTEEKICAKCNSKVTKSAESYKDKDGKTQYICWKCWDNKRKKQEDPLVKVKNPLKSESIIKEEMDEDPASDETHEVWMMIDDANAWDKGDLFECNTVQEFIEKAKQFVMAHDKYGIDWNKVNWNLIGESYKDEIYSSGKNTEPKDDFQDIYGEDFQIKK